jgi:hypothetical protein
MINCYRGSVLSLSVRMTSLTQLTTERPKPKKAGNRKNAGGLSPETGGGVRILSSSGITQKPSTRSAAAQGGMPTPSPGRVRQSSTDTDLTPSHANVLTPLNTNPLASRPNYDLSKRWNEQSSIGITSSDSAVLYPKEPSSAGSAGLDPLPPQKPSRTQPSPASPRSPRRQSRIPSTGSRALVMDIAQALQEVHGAPTAGTEVPPAAPQQWELQAPTMEKRKSSSDKYSTVVMPPLAEERKQLTTRVVIPEAVVKAKVESMSDVASPENNILPCQQDESTVEIRE